MVRLSLGGGTLRLRLSNELGGQPLAIGAVHVARPGKSPGSIQPASDRAVTFGGEASVVIQPGMPMVSDPLALETEALEDIVVTLYVARATGPVATHPLGMASTFIAESGPDGVSAPALDHPTVSSARFFLSEVDVQRPEPRAVVAFGDSITDGYGSSVDRNRRWPDFLAERLARDHRAIAVVNAGISGNRVLHDLPENEFGPSALARLDRDALSVSGAQTLILLESINDIGIPASSGLPEQAVGAPAIIAGLEQIVARAQARGMRVIGGTLLPFADTTYPGYYDEAGESKRQAVNRWIREGHGFDGVVDFDAALRDPKRPERLLPAYDSGDHLHPNDAGYRAMAEAVNIEMLTATGR